MLRCFAFVCSDLRQPDGSLYRFNLAKEGPNTAEIVVPPVLQQACGFRCDTPVAGLRNSSPFVDFGTHAVDDGRVVLLIFGGNLIAYV